MSGSSSGLACTAQGPCVIMAQAISTGTVAHTEGYARLANGAKLLSCPFCGADASPQTVTLWPWTLLRNAGIAHEHTEGV